MPKYKKEPELKSVNSSVFNIKKCFKNYEYFGNDSTRTV